MLFVCPGKELSFNCSLESPLSSIYWRIWCQCGADRGLSCSETCMAPQTASTLDTFQHGNLCTTAEHSPAITYNLNFTTITDGSDVLVSSSILSLAVPLNFWQHTLCINCRNQDHTYYLQVLGTQTEPNIRGLVCSNSP